MTLNQLRAFVAAERLGSFTAAAVALSVSQASVSELVQRLEDELHALLFVRGARRLTLTEAGQELLPYAQQSILSADEGEAAVRSLGTLGGGTATFGVLRNANYYFLENLVQAFHHRYPAVRVRLVGQNSAETAAAVASGQIEAGFVVLPVDDEGLVVEPLVRDEVLYVSPEQDQVVEPVTIKDVAEARLVLYDAHYGWRDPTRRQLAARAQLAGVTIEALIEVEHVESALRLVEGGVGHTIASRAVVTSRMFPEGLSTVSFSEPLFDTIAFIRRRGRPLSRATREFARFAEASLRKAGLGTARQGSLDET